MPNIGPLEVAIVAIIVLVIFGPKRLPELGRGLGSGMREFKDSITGKKKDDEVAELNAPPVAAHPVTEAAAQGEVAKPTS